MFGDLQGKEFDLESARLIRFLWLSRLTLALAAEGTWAIKNGRRHLVNQADRRDLDLSRKKEIWANSSWRSQCSPQYVRDCLPKTIRCRNPF